MSGDGMDIGFETGFALTGTSELRAPDREHTYDALVIGAGPAGLSAAIYLIRKRLDTAIITGNLGGQVTWTSSIENYLGYRVLDGAGLVAKFNEQIREFPVPLGLNEKVTALARRGDLFEVRTDSGLFRSRALVLATGKRPRMMNVPGEKELLGRGVAYCAICDAPLYRGKVTAVVGGGSSALEAAIDLAKVCPKVYILVRREKLGGDEVLRDRVRGLGVIEVIFGAKVLEVLGDGKVRGLLVRRGEGDLTAELAVEGVFVEIGLIPNSEAFRGAVELNERGEVEVDCRGGTSEPGIFAAGDVTTVPYKQIIVAAGEGAKAALSAHDYLLRRKG